MTNDIESLTKSADEWVEKAEKTGNLMFVTKSNSFRRTAKEKSAMLRSIDEELDIKLTALRQC